MTGLPREHRGFKGLIITDATPMAGYNCAMKHADAVLTIIAVGARGEKLMERDTFRGMSPADSC